MRDHCSSTLGLGLLGICVGEGTLAHPAALWLHCSPLAICISWDFQLCLENVLPGSLPRKYGFGAHGQVHMATQQTSFGVGVVVPHFSRPLGCALPSGHSSSGSALIPASC